jgi:hypothetical protein
MKNNKIKIITIIILIKIIDNNNKIIIEVITKITIIKEKIKKE